jgi:hypothetical protein
MKAWTQHQPRVDQLVQADQFNAEMRAARSSMMSLDRTQMPIDALTSTIAAPSALHRFYVTELVNGGLAYPGQQNTEIDTNVEAEGWACATFANYTGGWQTFATLTLPAHRGGSTIVEMIGTGYCNGIDHIVGAAGSTLVNNEKNLSVRCRVNGQTVAELLGVPHGVQTFRLVGAVQLPPGNHEVALDWRGTGPTANEAVVDLSLSKPIMRYHLFNMTFSAYARFR